MTAGTPSVKYSYREESLNAGTAAHLDRKETKNDAGEMTDNERSQWDLKAHNWLLTEEEI